jgi:hypothetical protein
MSGRDAPGLRQDTQFLQKPFSADVFIQAVNSGIR